MKCASGNTDGSAIHRRAFLALALYPSPVTITVNVWLAFRRGVLRSRDEISQSIDILTLSRDGSFTGGHGWAEKTVGTAVPVVHS